jgi:hypothetical protein
MMAATTPAPAVENSNAKNNSNTNNNADNKLFPLYSPIKTALTGHCPFDSLRCHAKSSKRNDSNKQQQQQ